MGGKYLWVLIKLSKIIHREYAPSPLMSYFGFLTKTKGTVNLFNRKIQEFITDKP